MLLRGLPPKIAHKSGVVSNPPIVGMMIQATKPRVIQ